MKESIVEGSMGFILAMVIANFRGFVTLKWKNFIVLPVLLYWLFKIKFYYFIVLISVLTMGILWVKTPGIKWYFKSMVMALVLLFGSLFLSKVHVHLHPLKVTGVIVGNHNDNYGFCFDRLSGGNLDAKGVIMYNHLNNSAGNLIYNTPNAWFSSVFRPLPFDASNVFQLAFAMLNLCLFFLGLICVQRLIINNPPWCAEAVMCVCYASILGTCMAFASPNMGTLARYKVGYLPFVIYLLFVYSNVLRSAPFKIISGNKYLAKLGLF